MIHRKKIRKYSSKLGSNNNNLRDIMTAVSEVWVQMFRCCVTEEHTHHHHPHRRNRPRIDRSMIGNPTDFRHTAHVGANDISSSSFGSNPRDIQSIMNSKGGGGIGGIGIERHK